MTDRINTITVVLEKPTRDDDAEMLMSAIRTMRGVLKVELGPVEDGFAVRDQVRKEVYDKIHEQLKWW